MKFKKILMVGYDVKDLGKKEWDRIDQLTDKKILLPKESPLIQKHLTTTDCLLVRLAAPVDKTIIDSAPNLKYIGILGTGYGKVDTEYAKKKKIAVCNIAGYSTEAVAELAFGFLLEQLREISRAKLQGKKGDYSESTFAGNEIKDKKFGVIGLGRIGGRIAEIAHDGFKAKVSYWSKNRKKNIEKKGIMYKPIEELLKESDFVSLNLAFVAQTEQFIDNKKIQLIKPGAIVLNLAPMELVDINALGKRLAKNDITFILDHADELSKENAELLSKHKNCVLCAPIGYVTKEATAAKLSLFVKNLKNFLKGTPSNKVN